MDLVVNLQTCSVGVSAHNQTNNIEEFLIWGLVCQAKAIWMEEQMGLVQEWVTKNMMILEMEDLGNQIIVEEPQSKHSRIKISIICKLSYNQVRVDTN